MSGTPPPCLNLTTQVLTQILNRLRRVETIEHSTRFSASFIGRFEKSLGELTSYSIGLVKIILQRLGKHANTVNRLDHRIVQVSSNEQPLVTSSPLDASIRKFIRKTAGLPELVSHPDRQNCCHGEKK